MLCWLGVLVVDVEAGASSIGEVVVRDLVLGTTGGLAASIMILICLCNGFCFYFVIIRPLSLNGVYNSASERLS